MTESIVMRWLVAAIGAILLLMYAAINDRLTALEDFRQQGDRCTALDCRTADTRITRNETLLQTLDKRVSELPPTWLRESIHRLEQRVAEIEREHDEFRPSVDRR